MKRRFNKTNSHVGSESSGFTIPMHVFGRVAKATPAAVGFAYLMLSLAVGGIVYERFKEDKSPEYIPRGPLSMVDATVPQPLPYNSSFR